MQVRARTLLHIFNVVLMTAIHLPFLNDKNLAADRSTLDEFKSTIEDLQSRHILTPSKALVDLIQNRKFFPVGGTVHIVGPGLDASEWLLFASIVPDMKIIVSERSDTIAQYLIETTTEDDYLRDLWKEYEKHHSAIIENARCSIECIIARVQGKDPNPIVFAQSGSQGREYAVANGQPVPKADFVLVAKPHAGAHVLYPQYGKPGALAWLITEVLSKDGTMSSKMVRHFEKKGVSPPDLNAFEVVLPLNVGALTQFLAPPDTRAPLADPKFLCAGFFNGMAAQGHGGEPYIMLYK